jgi:hypothetical protein
MVVHTDLSSAFFLHLLTPIGFTSFSVWSNHLNFGLPAFLLPSGFLRNTLFMVLSSEILTRWPAHSGFLTFYCSYNIWFSIHNLQFIISLDSLQPLWSFSGSYIFLSILCFHVLRDDFMCYVIAHVSQSYGTIGLIIVLYAFSFVFFELSPLVHFRIFIFTFCKILFLHEIFQRLCTCQLYRRASKWS